MIRKIREIQPGKRVPFVWHKMIEPVKKLVLTIEGKSKALCIDKIFKKDFAAGQDTVIVYI